MTLIERDMYRACPTENGHSLKCLLNLFTQSTCACVELSKFTGIVIAQLLAGEAKLPTVCNTHSTTFLCASCDIKVNLNDL